MLPNHGRQLAQLGHDRKYLTHGDLLNLAIKKRCAGIQAYRRIMKRVLERDGWRCRKCGSLENLQIHHQIKRSQLGDDALRNLVTLCTYCHMEEHGHLGFAGKAQFTKESVARGRRLHSATL